ncbi:MAG: DUF3857 domain-containing protein [Ferruginibacter sp.]
MKQLLFALTLSVSLSASSQNELPAFGKIDKADLEKKDCDYDKGAEAEVLIDWGKTYYDRGTSGISLFKTIFEYRKRVKIYNEKGIPQADVKITYYGHNNDEKILKVSAWTYNLDAAGNVQRTEAGKASIYTKRLNNFYSQLIIAFPEVKPGSVIEYRYTMERETMGRLRDWYFQGRIPVRYSEYQLTIPQIFRFSVQPSVIDSLEDKQEVIKERISVDNGFVETNSLHSTYVMRKLPGIKDEPFISTPKDYMQRLEFQLSQIDYGDGRVQDLRVKWSDVVKDLGNDEDFGKQLEKEVAGAASITAQAKTISGDENKVKFIYNSISKVMACTDDEAIYTDNGIAKAWEKKEGNAADINLLLVKLLRDAGVKASPILFSTRDNGLVNPAFPFLQQFNVVMAFVTAGSNYYVLDATDKYAPCKLTPQKITNSQGFVVEGETGFWKDVFSGKNKYKIMAALHAEIDAAGNIKGDGIINCNDYARRQRIEKWVKEQGGFRNAYFSTPPGVNLAELVVNNAEADSLPLEQKIKYTGILNGTGNYRYFTVNMFADLDKNPFLSDERVSDIDFGYNQEYIIYGNYSIPDEFVYDGLPENVSMIMPDTSIVFTRSVQTTDNVLNIRISIDFKRPFYSAALYPEFVAFYKKMFAKLNEQIVIKKKGT